jgi:formamidopyrimidine-DNA glycosylase
LPELPDIDIYVEALEARLTGEPLLGVRVGNPFLVRTYDPPLSAVAGKKVAGFRRVGKRVVFALEESLFIVVHLMIAGRFRYRETSAKLPGKMGLAAFDFPNATLILTEAGTRRRASLHVVRGEAALAALDPGGLEVMTATLAEFRTALVAENHTLKRSLTDPHFFSGIGNAYSDEILHRARLSPVRLTQKLDDASIANLFEATKTTLEVFRNRLRADAAGNFPENVTAFRNDMAVHGKFGKPCPVCDAKVQRIVHAQNEANYCATCQTGGKLLADRALSKLLRGDWPKSLEELEERKRTLAKS